MLFESYEDLGFYLLFENNYCVMCASELNWYGYSW